MIYSTCDGDIGATSLLSVLATSACEVMDVGTLIALTPISGMLISDSCTPHLLRPRVLEASTLAGLGTVGLLFGSAEQQNPITFLVYFN